MKNFNGHFIKETEERDLLLETGMPFGFCIIKIIDRICREFIYILFLNSSGFLSDSCSIDLSLFDAFAKTLRLIYTV